MPSTAGSVMARAAAHLNDVNQLSYTSAILLPFLNMALDEMEEELSVHEVAPLKKLSITIDVPGGSLIVPQMPTDFVDAISILERNLDSSNEWREIREVSRVDPNLAVTSSSEVLQWSTRGSTIYINPPSTDREIILDYIGGITVATGTGTVIDIESSRRYLALVTARNAARDLGNSPAKAFTFESDIMRARDRLVRRLVKQSQNTMGVRRLPFRGRGY